jgi:Tfp pilus assembly protein FimT
MLELVIVVAIILIIAGITAPRLVTIVEQERMQNATRAYASFLQQCRYRSEQDAQWYEVLFDTSNPSTTIAYLDINGDGQRQSTEPDVQIPAPIALIDPNNASIPTFAPNLIGVSTLLNVDTTPATWNCQHASNCSGSTQVAGLQFNERGLPCQRTSSTAACTNTTLVNGSGSPPTLLPAPVAWINYFSYPTSARGTNYSAVTITPAGRIKVWSYQGASGGGGSWY